MAGVKYIGPFKDHSGYGEASRNYILALHKAGYPITIQPHCFERNPPPVASAEEREVLNSLENKVIDYDKVIIHLTPDLAPVHARENEGKYLISYTVWETNLLHPRWSNALKYVDEVWVPSQWNIESFKRSGVEKPLYKIPHGIDKNNFEGITAGHFECKIKKDEDTFVFSSVMQWNSRKNPAGLLRAYYNAFKSTDNVKLLLKAYIGRGLSSKDEAEGVKKLAMRIRADMGDLDFPKVSLISTPLSDSQMKAMYLYSDCYVSLPHGEGWGLTMFEAGLAGKPVIATGAGGNMEFMTAENSYPISTTETFVAGMSEFNPWYLGNQRWFQPNLIEASEAMRKVYSDREEAKRKGQLLRQNIIDNFDWEVVSKKMIERLNEIDG